jgi:hypothetical protein
LVNVIISLKNLIIGSYSTAIINCQKISCIFSNIVFVHTQQRNLNKVKSHASHNSSASKLNTVSYVCRLLHSTRRCRPWEVQRPTGFNYTHIIESLTPEWGSNGNPILHIFLKYLPKNKHKI